MVQTDEIRHRGVVFNISGRLIDVAVKQEDACGSCKAKSVCAVGGDGERVVSVMSDMASIFKVGETVEVATSRAMGVRAVFFAYILPFLIMFILLLSLLQTGVSESAAGLSALAAVVLYYVALYFFRRLVEKTVIFKIYKIYE